MRERKKKKKINNKNLNLGLPWWSSGKDCTSMQEGWSGNYDPTCRVVWPKKKELEFTENNFMKQSYKGF